MLRAAFASAPSLWPHVVHWNSAWVLRLAAVVWPQAEAKDRMVAVQLVYNSWAAVAAGDPIVVLTGAGGRPSEPGFRSCRGRE